MKGFSLRTRLVVAISMMLLAGSVALMLMFPARMEAQSRVWLERRAVAVASAIERAVSTAMEADDDAAVEELFREEATHLDLAYAGVYRADGTLLGGYAVDKLPPPSFRANTDIVTRTENGVLEVVAPIQTRTEAGGTLVLGTSLSELTAQTEENRQTVLLMSIAVFGAGLLGSFLIGGVLVRPIRQMTVVAERIAANDLGEAQRLLTESGLGRDEPGNDEVAGLARSFGGMVASLRGTVDTLRQSARQLNESGQSLTASSEDQGNTISRQAAALQETHVTAEEIKQTSMMAAQKADAVIAVAERADAVGRSGEQAIEQTLSTLTEIRAQVMEISRKIAHLSERTKQIGSITSTVKDLADQSNILALNATIEAVRSGEHGKAFAVVAREIRSLADQSVQATGRVREILGDITHAIDDAVVITEQGSQRIENGLIRLNESGENLRQLSAIMRENSASVRQIAAAVSQQNTGITQIFGALSELSSMMDDTVARMGETTRASDVVRDVSSRVSTVVDRYRTGT